jgi:hypothetical protein
MGALLGLGGAVGGLLAGVFGLLRARPTGCWQPVAATCLSPGHMLVCGTEGRARLRQFRLSDGGMIAAPDLTNVVPLSAPARRLKSGAARGPS